MCWSGGVGGLQDLVEKHRAIFEDALLGNFSANDRISVCSARRIFSTFLCSLDCAQRMGGVVWVKGGVMWKPGAGEKCGKLGGKVEK